MEAKTVQRCEVYFHLNKEPTDDARYCQNELLHNSNRGDSKSVNACARDILSSWCIYIAPTRTYT